MTIAATTRKAGPFTGTGSVYQFEFTFKVFARSEVVVTVSSNDVETVLELDTDYSVSLNGDQDVNPGGTVTLDEALPEGDKLAITSAVPYSQEIALTNKGGFYPTILNEALDKLTAQCQQLQEQNTRTVTVPATSSISPSEYLNEIFDARETAIEKASAAASSASAASTSATNAQTWAEGTDAAVSVLGGTHSAKGWVNLMSPHFTAIEAVYADAENVDTVAASVTNVNTVAGSIAVVTSVANDLTAIDAVNNNKANINTVAGAITNVGLVASDIANVNSVASDLTNVDAVVANATNINAVAGNATNINAVNANKLNIDLVAGMYSDIASVLSISSDLSTVAGIASDVSAVAGIASDISAVEDISADVTAVASNVSNITAVASNIANVNAVATNAANINAVVANATNINTVATNASSITTVAGIASDVTTVATNATAVTTVATNVSDVSAVAADLTNIDAVAADLTNIDAASGYAAEAKQWAIGDPTEPSGGSAKYWAQQASAGQVNSDWSETDTTSKAYILNKPTLATVATSGDYSDLSNTPTDMVGATASTDGENGFVPAPLADEEKTYLRGDGTWQDALEGRISNCITSIPQDIKLELSNGTLTLKAGSKFYIPNGSGVFDEVVTTADISWSNRSYNGTQMLVFKADGSKEAVLFANCFSGNTTPTSSGYNLWYDTANNLVKFYNDNTATWDAGGWSLPVAIVTSTATDGWQSIDQVFNGFGYIGSTIFVLPNVKGLIPNGRNEDGSLQSTAFTTSSVIKKTGTNVLTGGVLLNANDIGVVSGAYYNESANRTFFDGAEYKYVSFVGFLVVGNDGRVVSWSIPTSFRALNWSDSATIAGWSAPSSVSTNLTLGSSGATYTAPANGWVVIEKATAGTGQWISVYNNTGSGVGFNIAYYSSGYGIRISVPVSKGDEFQVNYSLTGSTSVFRFVYAVGEV